MTTADALARLETELNEATARARRLADSTPARLFTVRPEPTRWSAAECLAHLSISTELFLPVLEEALAKARRRGLKSNSAPRMDWLGGVLRWFLEPPARSRVKTSAPFVPRSVRTRSESVAEFTALQSQLIGILRSSADVPIGKVKIISPFDKRVRYNIYSAFRIVAAHERRHLWQAEQAVEALKKAAHS